MPTENEFKKYHEYLLTRSLFGHFYRKYIVYPAISKHIKGKVLDIGCGIGDFCKYQNNTTGIDINPFNINYCKSRGLKNVFLIKKKFPLKDQEFDSAVLDNVLEHLESPEELLYEVRRVLKTNGIFVIGVPGIKGHASDPDHKVFYDLEKMKQLLKMHNFEYKIFFNTPLNVQALSSKMRQFCLYGVFTKS